MEPSSPYQTSRESRLSIARQNGDGPAYGNTPASRRSSVASAIGSITKFKESWMSIMFLKAGVGLGQVIVLIVLLVLASSFTSPLAPGRKQVEATEACPRPVLFQSWMIVQIIRLTVCWSISCLVAVRARRRGRYGNGMEEERQVGAIAIPHSPSTSIPSLIHSPFASPSSSSTDSMDFTRNNALQAPGRSYSRNMHSPTNSSGSFEMLSTITRTKDGRTDSDPSVDTAPSTPGIETIPTTPGSARPITYRAAQNNTLDLARATRRSQSPTLRERRRHLGARFDMIAPKLTKMLGVFSFILFLLGNILLFYPPPTQQQTCYHASPMLWWGVMTVIGVGWFLFGQIVVVVLVIGVGGPAILTSLRRLPCFPAPAESGSTRAPQAAPLTSSELAKLPLVCYIPLEDNEKSEWDTTRCPYLAHPLRADQATCAICQDNYSEPEAVRRVLYQADPLRLLGCGHVYHADCIDKWLTEKSSICPYCNQCARQTMVKEKAGDPVRPRRWWLRGDSS